jgi:hypothetical protein
MRGKLTFANVMSVVAMFIALGGVGYAAVKLPKNSVGTRQLKANAVTGAKVRNGSLTGADINESTLGTVPSAATAGHATSAGTADNAGHADAATHATSADSAADAEKLGGVGPSGYLGAGTVQRFESPDLTKGGGAQLLSAGDLTLRATCQEGGPVGSTVVSVDASSSGTNPIIDRAAVETGVSSAKSFPVGPASESVFAVGSESGLRLGMAWIVFRDSAHAVTVTLSAEAGTGGEGFCSVAGTAVVD